VHMRGHERDVTSDHVSELITVISAVETFLGGYLKANPGHSLATVLCQTLQARLQVMEGDLDDLEHLTYVFYATILYTALDKTFFFDLSEPEWGSPMTETAWNV
jgi:hypothetical protein